MAAVAITFLPDGKGTAEFFEGFHWRLEEGRGLVAWLEPTAKPLADVANVQATGRRFLRRRPGYVAWLGAQPPIRGPVPLDDSPSALYHGMGGAVPLSRWTGYLTAFTPLDALALAYQLEREEVAPPVEVVPAGKNGGWLILADGRRFDVRPIAASGPRRRVLEWSCGQPFAAALAPDEVNEQTAIDFVRAYERLKEMPQGRAAMACFVALLGIPIREDWLEDETLQSTMLSDEVITRLAAFVAEKTLRI